LIRLKLKGERSQKVRKRAEEKIKRRGNKEKKRGWQ